MLWWCLLLVAVDRALLAQRACWVRLIYYFKYEVYT